MKKYFVLIVVVFSVFLAKNAKAEYMSFNGCLTSESSSQPIECKGRGAYPGLYYDMDNIELYVTPTLYNVNYSYPIEQATTGTFNFMLKTMSTSTTPGQGATKFYFRNNQNNPFWFYLDTLNNTISGYSINGGSIEAINLGHDMWRKIEVGWSSELFTICVNTTCDSALIGTYKPPINSLVIELPVAYQVNHNLKSFSIKPVEINEYDSVEIINLDESGDVKVGLEAPFKAYNKTCIIGEDCFLDVGYGYQSIGKSLQFRHAEDDSLISTTTLLDLPILKTKLEVPDESFSAKFYYCLSIDFGYVNPTWTGVIKDCTYSVKWVTQEYFDENIAPGFAEFDINSACESVATSSGEMWDDFRYGIECGFRKMIYWATVPSPQTYFKIEEAKENLMTSFPFTYYRQVQRIVYNSTTGTSSPVSVNMGTFIHDDFMPDMNDKILFSAEIIKEPLSDKWDLIQNTMKYLVYVALGMYLINRLISMSSNEKV